VKLKMILLLTFLFMITIGCSNAKSDDPLANVRAAKAAPTYSGLLPSLSIKQEGKVVHVTFVVKNSTDTSIPLQFNTTQHFDYVIEDSSGKKVKKYSEGLMFGQIVTRRELAKGEHLDYDTEITGLTPGSYKLTIWLTDATNKPKISQTFNVQ
jgi:hypothetical protein